LSKQELIQKCPCEKSDDIEQVGSSEANLIWVSNDKSASRHNSKIRWTGKMHDYMGILSGSIGRAFGSLPLEQNAAHES
jgi:hypothetical protein